jgi:DNA invertase Pin-like site-specific DNA recombinase
MATIGYILLSSNLGSNYHQACDIGKADYRFLEKASYQSLRILKRPKFLEALKVLHKGDTFAVSTLSVLSTNPKDMLEALQALQRKGVTVVFVQEGFTLSTSLGKAYLAMLRSVAQLEDTLRRIRI